MSFTLYRRHTVALAGLALAAGLAAMLFDPSYSHAALQKMAGYERSDATTFASIISYISNLRDGLIPVAIPTGTIGLIAGGFMYFFGNQMASKVIFGVLGGLGLVLCAPGIVS